MIGAVIVAFILILLLFLSSKMGNGDSSRSREDVAIRAVRSGTFQCARVQSADGPEMEQQ